MFWICLGFIADISANISKAFNSTLNTAYSILYTLNCIQIALFCINYTEYNIDTIANIKSFANTHSDSNSNNSDTRIRGFETIWINFESSANALGLLTVYTPMLTLNSLKIQIRISKYYAIISSTSHINSRLLIASFFTANSKSFAYCIALNLAFYI